MFEFGGSLQELLLILVVALLVVGPKRLPEVGRALARAMRELRRAQNEFRSTLETNLQVNDPVVVPTPAERDAIEAASIATPQLPSSTVDTRVMMSHVEPTGAGVKPYLAQRGARLFHSRDCYWATHVKASERVGFDSEDGATAEGLLPCPVCRQSSA